MTAYLSLMGLLCPKIKQIISQPIGIYKPPILTFLFIISFVFVGLAQEIEVHSPPVAKAEATAKSKNEIIPLKIGDKIPDVLWDMLFPVVSTKSDEIQQMRLGDFKDKLIILDFWATWCSPCVAMIPKMDSLQKVFGDKMQFLSVTYQKKEEVLPFLAKLEQVKETKYHLPVLTNDEHFRFLFPHRELPHYVWIENGVVKIITGYEEVNAGNIQAALNREQTELKAKIDEKRLPYDRKKPLFVDGNGGNGKAMRYHSVLAGYTLGLSAGYSLVRDSVYGNQITLTNSPLYDLYSTAFGGGSLKYRNLNRMIFEVKESDKFMLEDGGEYKTWIVENGYTYEIKVPVSLNERLYEFMRNDLEKLLPQYRVGVEKRKTTCLVLVRTSKKDKLKSKSQKTKYKSTPFGYTLENGSLSGFVNHLNLFPLQHSLYPLVDGTGYLGKVDLEIAANLSDVSSLNEALKKYDLNIIEDEREIEMLVISDNEEFYSGSLK